MSEAPRHKQSPSTSRSTNDTVTEGEAFSVKVKLDDASAQTTSTRIRTTITTSDTATAGADYQTLDQTVVFTPGETEKILTIATIDDNLAERTQTLTAELYGHSGLTAGSTVTKTLTIEEEAADLAITFEMENIFIEEDAGTLRVRTRLSRATEGMTYTITYGITSGTAVSPGDYDAASSQIPVVVGEGQTEIIMDRVDIIDDDIPEQDESFTVTGSATVATGLPITVSPVTGKGTATVTIIDEDNIPRLRFEVTNETVTEGATLRGHRQPDESGNRDRAGETAHQGHKRRQHPERRLHRAAEETSSSLSDKPPRPSPSPPPTMTWRNSRSH